MPNNTYNREAMLNAIADSWQKKQEVLESDPDYPFEDDVDVTGDEDLDDDEFSDE